MLCPEHPEREARYWTWLQNIAVPMCLTCMELGLDMGIPDAHIYRLKEVHHGTAEEPPTLAE